MEEKLYPVFQVDVCFSSYAMDYELVGAETISDLKEHLNEIFGNSLTKEEIKKIKHPGQNDFNRIKKLDGIYTKEPYKNLTSYGYYE